MKKILIRAVRSVPILVIIAKHLSINSWRPAPREKVII